MYFARPEMLRLLWLAPLLATFILWFWVRRRRRMEALVSVPMARRLAADFSRGKAFLRAIMPLGFVTFGILALARPQWGMRQETVHRTGVDVIAALDVSYSMNAEDISPSRLEKARGEVRSLLSKLRGDRFGLVCFAGSATVQCPLTLDYGAIQLFLDMASPGMMPEPGTSLSAAIRTADAAFIARERKYKVLVIFTDGEDLAGQVESAMEAARESGVVIYTIGVGTAEGRPIPVKDEKGNVVEYHRDPSGQVVISRLDERALAEIATRTGGRYFRATTTEGELDEILSEISGMDKKELESRLLRNFEDRFQYPLAAGLICLLVQLWISERRGAGQNYLASLRRKLRREPPDLE